MTCVAFPTRRLGQVNRVRHGENEQEVRCVLFVSGCCFRYLREVKDERMRAEARELLIGFGHDTLLVHDFSNVTWRYI